MKKYLLIGVLALGVCSCQQNNPAGNMEDYGTQFTLMPTDYTGVEFVNSIVETAEQNHLVNDMLISGAGVTIGDINNDDLPDLFLTGNQVQDRLFLNKGNLQFEDITDRAKILKETIWSTGATMADVNNDGYLDIYVCKYEQGNQQLSENLLYINNGDLTFTENAKSYRLADRGFGVQANFLDVNNDGNLDLFIVNQPTSVGKRQGKQIVIPKHERSLYSDRLYINTGKGSFIEISGPAGVASLAFGLSGTAGDVNGDGYVDLYVANDYELPDFLYINQKDGSFKNNANRNLKHISNFSMGTDIADYDNDGFLDIVAVDMVAEDHVRIKTHMGGMNPDAFWDLVDKGYHYQYMFNTLQRNNGDGTFSEVGHLAGISNTDWSWSALFSDFDNDGYKDLFVTNGVRRAMRNSDLDNIYIRKMDSLKTVSEETGKSMEEVMDIMEFVELAPIEKLKNYIFKNNGDFSFTKKSDEWGLGIETLSYGAAYADLDLDGDVDLVVSNTDEVAFIYRNNAIENNQGNYLTVKVSHEHGSPYYGAKVKLYKGDDIWQLVELTNVRGYKSKSHDLAHFGLGQEEQIDKVEIVYPTGDYEVFDNVQANQMLEVTKREGLAKLEDKTVEKQFKSMTRQVGLNHLYRENDFDDYEREVLLPHKMSNFGPAMSVGDVNGDDLEDFYVGGAAGFPGTLYRQTSNQTFEAMTQKAIAADSVSEDLGSALFDFDGDGDLDLYVVSGGNEFEPNSPDLIDRLYVNDGKGNFKKSNNTLPDKKVSGSVVKPADYDQDGDLDLFVGGRLVPGRYPFPAESYLLENRNGKFVDVSAESAPYFKDFGLVTSAQWLNINNDKYPDLIVSGEWMPVKILINNAGVFEDATETAGLGKSTGWYYSLTAADFDGDGDDDIIAGNLGLNYKYKASLDLPFEVYSGDLDGNGFNDIVLSYNEHGHLYPVRGKSCSSEQMPSLNEKFDTYNKFANSSVSDLYGEALGEALHYKAYNFATVYLENLGDGTFDMRKLDNAAQFSSVNSMLIRDFNEDGNLDIVLCGNLYPAEIETPRNDAGMGLYMTGDGKGNFTPVHIAESGFFAPLDAKDMKFIKLGKEGQEIILVGNNQHFMQAIGFSTGSSTKETETLSMK